MAKLFTVRSFCLSVLLDGGDQYSIHLKFLTMDTFGYTVNDDPAGQTWRTHMENDSFVEIKLIFLRLSNSDLSYNFLGSEITK